MRRFPATTAMRRHLAASVWCGLLISGSAIASAVLLAHLVAGVITDENSRTVAHWAPTLSILLGLWTVRVLTQWLQAGSASGAPPRRSRS